MERTSKLDETASKPISSFDLRKAQEFLHHALRLSVERRQQAPPKSAAASILWDYHRYHDALEGRISL